MTKNYLRIKDDVRGFFALQNDIIDNTKLLNTNEKMVYIVLMRFGETVFPSVQAVADRAGMSESTARRTLNSLVKKGLVERSKRFDDDGSQTSNLYTLVNTREVWESTTSEELKAAITAAEEADMVAKLRKLGYDITKKESVPAGTSTDSKTARKSAPKSQDNRTTYSRKKQPRADGAGVTAAELERSRQAMLQMLGDD